MSMPPKIKPSSIVNAYLFYAQRLLQFDYVPPYMTTQSDKRVISASVCLCLKQAWQAWLDEMGRYLNKNLSNYSDFLLPEHRTHPEIEALLSLKKQPSSWLSQLLLCLEPMVHASPVESVEQVSSDKELPASPGRIQLRQIDQDDATSTEPHVPKDAAGFLLLIDGFKAYTQSVRLRQEEW